MIKKISIQKKVLIAILIFTALTRLFRLDFPKTYVFDEVYHGFTAREFAAGHKEAWEWWTTPPPGVAYEWTHPPLAKEIMAGSMFLLNTTETWAYRLPGVLLGILSVYLVYLLGIKLLKQETASLIAAFIFSIDGLNFVQSRTGMNDIYFVTFMLASFLFLLNKRFFLSSIMVGLAISSKWTAIYVYMLFIPFALIQNKALIFKFIKALIKLLPVIKPVYLLYILYFAFIPLLVYLISYIPFFLHGHSIDQFIELQKQMWWYHTGLKATHGYASPWWSWPLNLYPVWYFVDYQKDKIANIFTSGNPVVFWVGSAAIILTTIEGFMKKNWNLIIISLGFFVFWLPWAVSPRIMFLYHFSPSVPFLCLALGYQLSELGGDRISKTVLIILSLMVLSFILIYPLLTGIGMPKEFVNLFFQTNLSDNPFN